MQQSEQKSDKFKCNECGLTFNSERERREHEENAHRRGSGQGSNPGGQGQSSGQR
jgi:hypothetical protein